jgi:hypothetical protein
MNRPNGQGDIQLPTGFLTIGEAARAIQFTTDAIHQCLVDRRLRFTRFAGKRVIAETDLREFEKKWVERQTRRFVRAAK